MNPALRLKWFLVACVWLVFLGPQPARALKYRPAKNENLSAIALKHYGKEKKSIYITTANKIADPKGYRGRKVIWIPTVWKYRFKAGDSLEKLAAKYFKTSRRANYLMWLNKIKKPQDIKVGTLLTIPFTLHHRARSKTTLKTISRLYYWTDREARRLRDFNGKRNNQVRAGEVIEVPIFDPQAQTGRVRARLNSLAVKERQVAAKARERSKQVADVPKAKKPEPSPEPRPDMKQPVIIAKSQPSEALPTMDNGSPADNTVREILDDSGGKKDDSEIPPQIATLLQEAKDLYQEGAYELARATLARVLEHEEIPQADEGEARELLAFCLVALDRLQQAEHEFVRLLMVSPDHKLDPVTTSPKIMKVFKKANSNQ